MTADDYYRRALVLPLGVPPLAGVMFWAVYALAQWHPLARFFLGVTNTGAYAWIPYALVALVLLAWARHGGRVRTAFLAMPAVLAVLFAAYAMIVHAAFWPLWALAIALGGYAYVGIVELVRRMLPLS